MRLRMTIAGLVCLFLSLGAPRCNAQRQIEPISQRRGQIDHVGNGVTAPVLQRFVAPLYSQQAIEAHYGGLVIAWAIVETDGQLTNVLIQQAAGMGLDQAAVKALRKWHFAPSLKNGQPVAVQVWIQVFFDKDTLEVATSLERLNNPHPQWASNDAASAYFKK